jgi:hypothetical protein
MSFLSRWKQSGWAAKTVAALAVLLTLQIGLCFASPDEPPSFDALFHIQPGQDELRIGLVFAEALGCVVTFIMLLIAISARLMTFRVEKNSVARKKHD